MESAQKPSSSAAWATSRIAVGVLRRLDWGNAIVNFMRSPQGDVAHWRSPQPTGPTHECQEKFRVLLDNASDGLHCDRAALLGSRKQRRFDDDCSDADQGRVRRV